ncbi:MAG: DUF945 family protein [Saezia sp.]
MKKTNLIKKSLLAAALGLSMGSFAVASADLTSAASHEPTSVVTQHATPDLTKENLQEWVQGLQVAFPFYDIKLVSYEDTAENRSVATVSISLGQPAKEATPYGANLYMSILAELDIEHGFKSENGIASIARINYTTTVQDNSSPEFMKMYQVMTSLLERLKYGSVMVIQPDGEFYAESKSTQAFEMNEEELSLSIPSFTSQMQTYGGKRLLRSQAHVPFIEVNDLEEGRQVLLHGLRINEKDKTIRDGVYQLNGKTDVSVEKIEYLEEGQRLATLNDLKYTESGRVDERGLYQGQVSLAFSGQETLSSRMNDRKPAPVRFSLSLKGEVQNFHANSHIDFYRGMMNAPERWMDEEAFTPVLMELLGYGPRINFEKVNLTLNGHQGEGSLKMEIPPLTAQEKEMPFVFLMLQKLRVDASMRMPIEWFELVEPDQRARKELVERFLKESGGYIERKGNYLITNISYQEGALTVNGKPFEMF